MILSTARLTSSINYLPPLLRGGRKTTPLLMESWF